MTKKKTAIKLGPNYSGLCDAVEKHDPEAAKWMREVGAKRKSVDSVRYVWEDDPADISEAFTWNETPQGFSFWENLNALVERDRKSAKPAAPKKPKPLPLDPLEIQIINQIDAEDESDIVARKAELDNSRKARIAARLAQAQASIRGELPAPLAGVPEADSGEALVGRWCVVWDDGSEMYPRIYPVKDLKGRRYTDSAHGDHWDHASPWERGIPEAIRKAVEG